MNYISRNVSVVNLDTDSCCEGDPDHRAAARPASQDEQIQVGEEVFFASRGVFDGGKTNRLSSEGWQNCASCHFAGLTDGNVWAFDAGPRKSVPLNGTWNPHDPDDQRVLNYSAIFDEVQDFELNIRNVSGPGNDPCRTGGCSRQTSGLLISDTGDINARAGGDQRVRQGQRRPAAADGDAARQQQNLAGAGCDERVGALQHSHAQRAAER